MVFSIAGERDDRIGGVPSFLKIRQTKAEHIFTALPYYQTVSYRQSLSVCPLNKLNPVSIVNCLSHIIIVKK